MKKKEKETNKCDLVEFVIQNRKKLSCESIGLPDELINEYPMRMVYTQKRGKSLFFTGHLDKFVMSFWQKFTKRYPFSFYMNLQILTHLMAVATIIDIYHPKAIATTETENDCSTTAITAFCENYGIEYIGIMHGEYLLSPLHAYVRFSRFYVWDMLYIDQFVRSHCNSDYFRVYRPKMFNMNINNNAPKNYFLTYYLQNQDKEMLIRIKDVLSRLTEKGKKCKIRLHPRLHNANRNKIEKIFQGSNINIENDKIISIKESLSNTEYAVSMSSSVLSEAYENDIKAVIDDVSDISYYKYLQDTMYVNISRIHERLSKLIEKI